MLCLALRLLPPRPPPADVINGLRTPDLDRWLPPRVS